jgi:hypothetical protein
MTTDVLLTKLNNRFCTPPQTPFPLLLQENVQQTSDAADVGGEEPTPDTAAVAAAKSYREKRKNGGGEENALKLTKLTKQTTHVGWPAPYFFLFFSLSLFLLSLSLFAVAHLCDARGICEG